KCGLPRSWNPGPSRMMPIHPELFLGNCYQGKCGTHAVCASLPAMSCASGALAVWPTSWLPSSESISLLPSWFESPSESPPPCSMLVDSEDVSLLDCDPHSLMLGLRLSKLRGRTFRQWQNGRCLSLT